MNQIWKVMINGARWIWKNSWWMVPAGETVYQRLKTWLIRRKSDSDVKQPNT